MILGMILKKHLSTGVGLVKMVVSGVDMMRSNFERFVRWREIWYSNNKCGEDLEIKLNLPKKIALKEMTGYLIKWDREIR